VSCDSRRRPERDRPGCLRVASRSRRACRPGSGGARLLFGLAAQNPYCGCHAPTRDTARAPCTWADGAPVLAQMRVCSRLRKRRKAGWPMRGVDRPGQGGEDRFETVSAAMVTLVERSSATRSDRLLLVVSIRAGRGYRTPNRSPVHPARVSPDLSTGESDRTIAVIDGMVGRAPATRCPARRRRRGRSAAADVLVDGAVQRVSRSASRGGAGARLLSAPQGRRADRVQRSCSSRPGASSEPRRCASTSRCSRASRPRRRFGIVGTASRWVPVAEPARARGCPAAATNRVRAAHEPR
jgi:hypothetical protein